jgi:hypothetical protein
MGLCGELAPSMWMGMDDMKGQIGGWLMGNSPCDLKRKSKVSIWSINSFFVISIFNDKKLIKNQ